MTITVIVRMEVTSQELLLVPTACFTAQTPVTNQKIFPVHEWMTACVIVAMLPMSTSQIPFVLTIAVIWVSRQYETTKNFNFNLVDCTGKEDRIREKQKAELAKMGNQLRAEMAAKGKAMKAEQASRLEELKRSYAEAEALANEREVIKKEAEALEADALAVFNEAQMTERRQRSEREAIENSNEAEDIFTKYDSNQDGKLEIAEIQTRIAFDKNRNGEVCEEEAKFFLSDHDEVDFETFKTLCWPRIKPFLMLDSGLFKPPALVEDLKDNAVEDADLASELADDASLGEEDMEHEHDDEAVDEEEFEEETGEGDVSAKLYVKI